MIEPAQSHPDRAQLAPTIRRASLDVVGAALIALTALWMVLVSTVSGGSPRPGVALLVGTGIVWVAARLVASRSRLVVPAAIAITASFMVVSSRAPVLSIAPLSGPLRYGNADGALYVQASVAALMVTFATRLPQVRVLGAMAAVAFAFLPFFIHSSAAAVLVVTLPAIAIGFASVGPRGARLAVQACGILFVGALSISIVLGATYSRASEGTPLQRLAASTIDQRRLELWHDAIVILREHPIYGVGPRRFQIVSPIASHDPDSRWAHNEFLQQGAEGGVPGLVLLILLFLWGFVRLLAARPDVITALGAASLAALGIHACIDYVMHFPSVPLMAAALVGAGMAATRWSDQSSLEPVRALEEASL